MLLFLEVKQSGKIVRSKCKGTSDKWGKLFDEWLDMAMNVGKKPSVRELRVVEVYASENTLLMQSPYIRPSTRQKGKLPG